MLDENWPQETTVDGEASVMRVNWLKRQTLFDFNRVEIKQASDEEVERFMTQIGNDTDDWRTSHYPQIRCDVSAQCDLSENTLRILRDTFAEVELAPRWIDD